MKKVYQVSMEASVSRSVKIEAESAEEAVLLAKRDHSEQNMDVSLSVTWLDEDAKAEETGELSIEVELYCDQCGLPMLRRHERVDDTKEEKGPTKDWPWSYGTPSQEQVGAEFNPDYFTWCYGCMQSPLKQLADAAE